MRSWLPRAWPPHSRRRPRPPRHRIPRHRRHRRRRRRHCPRGGAATPYPANFDPGLAAIDAAGNAEPIKWLAYFASLEFYPAGTDGRLGLVANYGHMQSSNARSAGTASAAGTTPAAQAAAVARIRDHEDYFELGALVDPTRATRIAVSGSLYDDVYGDAGSAKNYAVIASAWLFF
jgi:hypothetical protein